MNDYSCTSLGKPSVSTRVNISWPPEPPAEDSSVLVLSSRSFKDLYYDGQPSLLYLDLRLSLPGDINSTINWAFSGIRHTLQSDPHPKYRWEHFIDSRRGLEGSDTVDEGETITSKDLVTGKATEIEAGFGWNNVTRQVARYEEVWCDKILPSHRSYAFMTLGDEPQLSKAFIAILGDDALALSQETGVPFHAVHMARVSDDNWQLIYVSCSPSLLQLELQDLINQPSSAVESWCRGEKVHLGSTSQSRLWTVFDCGRS